MLLKANDLLDKKVKHSETKEDNIDLSGILLNKYDFSLCYLSFEETVPADPGNEESFDPIDKNVLNMQAATSGIGSQSTPLSGTGYPVAARSYYKETYYIPWHDIISLDDDIVYQGNERQIEEPVECMASSIFDGWTVETIDGEKIGKIKDVILDTISKKAVAIEIAEGFWSKLLGEGNKYMPIAGEPNWVEEKWIVEPELKDHLVNEKEDIKPLF
ncbi:PRC-barrel domain-containing protein [Fictibacillus sp. KIGAM418]|uniref:PRC-barrel domain-containing protein n=1 Tax=Fictibacillus marinisediminis TaxID=2878389 RepID=A0A9X1XEL2_9BACL|nr:PRC-barrel domain-containing protein [Fictibacillus marinisediminis]MCK6258113.1 PRC-barrel domain-containing protein [Fictibacillus marinisediminis]